MRFGSAGLECAISGRQHGLAQGPEARPAPLFLRLTALNQVLISHADRFQGMGSNRPRSRGGRAAADAAQGRHPRGEQALRARARALLPLPDLRPPAQRPGARIPPPGAGAARSRRASGPTRSRRRKRCSRTAASPSPTASDCAPGPRSIDHVTINDRRTLDSLSPYYIWTPDYAEKRLTWKRRHPLHVLLLRVHRIPRPVTVRVRDEYHGCRSWVEIDRDLPFEGTPVMADEEFDRARQEIRSVCGSPEPALV